MRKKIKNLLFLGFLNNKFNGKKDTSTFNISVIKDLYPLISVNQEADTIKEGVFYFNGKISDDYGLKSLF